MRLSILVMLGLLCCLRTAAAQAADDGDGEARTHFEAAQAHFETGSYEDAIREFEAAYRLSKRAALLYNVYLCHERLGNLDAAIDHLARYLELDPETANAASLRIRLEKLRARAAAREPDDPSTSRIGRIRIALPREAPAVRAPPPAPPSPHAAGPSTTARRPRSARSRRYPARRPP